MYCINACTLWRENQAKYTPYFTIYITQQSTLHYSSLLSFTLYYSIPYALYSVIVPHPVVHRSSTLFLAWSPFSVRPFVLSLRPSVCALAWFLEVFSKTISPINFILGIHDLLGGIQIAIAYCHAWAIFHRMLASDWSILSQPLSLQPLIILLSYWNCELT